MVGAGVLVVADAQAGHIEQPDDRGDDAFVPEIVTAQVAVDSPAQRPEPVGEREETVELVARPVGGEVVVVAVLLASLGVATGRLDVAVGIAGDPYVGPSRWDGEGADPFDVGLRGGLAGAFVVVGEPLRAAPPDPLFLVRSEPQCPMTHRPAIPRVRGRVTDTECRRCSYPVVGSSLIWEAHIAILKLVQQHAPSRRSGR